MRHSLYPLTAIVGQKDMKLSLILNVINPSLGGVLLRGEKGTAKSTAVRALAEILPPLSESDAQADDVLKVIDLPISATEDRVVGTLDVEQAIKTGEKKFEAGILKEADENILYVDEINLLEDHLVDVLLDAAAMGVNTIEREGISYSHSAKFALVGTMNPEEGDLRPQLLDRFALSVEVCGEREVERRVEVLKRRLEFEKDPSAFLKKYEQEQLALRERILHARRILPTLEIEDRIIEMAAAISIAYEVEGHRSDITIVKTAMTIAAFENRNTVENEDVRKAATLVLPHRLKRKPFEERTFDHTQLDDIMKKYQMVHM